MKRVTTKVTEDFDEAGKLVTRITETTEETDDKPIYQAIPYYGGFNAPWNTPAPTIWGQSPFTCNNEAAFDQQCCELKTDTIPHTYSNGSSPDMCTLKDKIGEAIGEAFMGSHECTCPGGCKCKSDDVEAEQPKDIY